MRFFGFKISPVTRVLRQQHNKELAQLLQQLRVPSSFTLCGSTKRAERGHYLQPVSSK